MLFHITQVHTPETCPRDEGGIELAVQPRRTRRPAGRPVRRERSAYALSHRRSDGRQRRPQVPLAGVWGKYANPQMGGRKSAG